MLQFRADMGGKPIRFFHNGKRHAYAIDPVNFTLFEMSFQVVNRAKVSGLKNNMYQVSEYENTGS